MRPESLKLIWDAREAVARIQESESSAKPRIAAAGDEAKLDGVFPRSIRVRGVEFAVPRLAWSFGG